MDDDRCLTVPLALLARSSRSSTVRATTQTTASKPGMASASIIIIGAGIIHPSSTC